MDATSFQHDRLLVAGHVVRPVVHDLNNFLGAAMAYAELAQMEPGVSPVVSRHLREVLAAVSRSTHLMGHYAQLARPLYQAQHFDAAAAVQGALDLYMYTLRIQAIRLETDFVQDLPKAVGFPAALQHAILVLVMHSERRLAGREGDRFLRVGVHAEESDIVVHFESSPSPLEESSPTSEDASQLDLTLESAQHAIEFQHGTWNSLPEGGVRITLPRAPKDLAAGD